jgi:hypothetical protein
VIWLLGDLGLQVIKSKKTIPVMAATPPASGHNGGIPRNQQHVPRLSPRGGLPGFRYSGSSFKELLNRETGDPLGFFGKGRVLVDCEGCVG